MIRRPTSRLRSNIVSDPNDFTSGNWTVTGTMTRTADDGAAPNGTLTADKLNDTSGANSASCGQLPLMGTEFPGRPRMFEFYFKQQVSATNRVVWIAKADNAALATIQTAQMVISPVDGDYRLLSTGDEVGYGIDRVSAVWYRARLILPYDPLVYRYRYVIYPAGRGDLLADSLDATQTGYIHTWGAGIYPASTKVRVFQS